MDSFKKLVNIAGWTVFGIATIVYFFSVERTGSLWDCGEFITGAYKLQVVHPPGAALFLLIGRMFAMVGSVISDDPATIAFAVNMLSGVCSAFAAMFICWVTIMLGKMAIVEKDEAPTSGQEIALLGAGVIAGLATAFSTSIWFSAVEGEVYAMSTFFTALTLWAVIKWYNLPDKPDSDRWLVFAIYSAGLSIGVHLLSILTFPALALFYYFKKYENHTLLGMAGASAIGVVMIVALQTLIITGIPHLWTAFELMMVNSFGLPFHSGVVPTVLLIGSLLTLPLLYLHGKIKSLVPIYAALGVLALTIFYYLSYGGGPRANITLGGFAKLSILIGVLALGANYALDRYRYLAQLVMVSMTLVVISFSTVGVIVIRANANTPINMNAPSDPMRLLPYLNREQYGERSLFNGPNFDIPRNAITHEVEDRYGRVEGNDKYVITDRKITQNIKSSYKTIFPRMQDGSQSRPQLYKIWMSQWGAKGSPSVMDNIQFTFRYQLGWMYWRYFMWNFGGRQNGDQGFYSWDATDGNWQSGISFLDSSRLYNQAEEPSRLANNKARNKYYMLPFFFGLLGLFFHFSKDQKGAMGLFALFIITGVGLIIYSNQPPNEPRERDYVLIGSFFTYCIWIGMAALALFEILRKNANLAGKIAAPAAVGLIMLAPLLMGFQNFDDHSRRYHSGARDYANNFLQSCEPNAIIFTYGDNDTYPLWYAQEVENIRTDVRVVNLSLIAVDWYIDQLRRKVNNSEAIKMSIPMAQLRGYKRNQLIIPQDPVRREYKMPLCSALKIVGEDHPEATNGQLESYMPTSKLSIPVNKAKARSMVSPEDYDKIVDEIVFDVDDIYREDNAQGKAPRNNNQLLKGDIAVLDIICSNFQDRPIYFAVTCRPQSMLGLDDYFQLEGLGLKLVPLKNRDASYSFLGMMGKGKIDADKTLEIMSTKFKWGGFDKHDTFVDRSFGPAIQSQKAGMVRAAQTFLDREDKDKAVEMADLFFKAFPFMNFKYEYQALQMLDIYVEAGEYSKAKPHIQDMAKETAEYLKFFESIDDQTRTSRYGFGRENQFYNGFSRGQQQSSGAKGELMRLVQQAGDTEYLNELRSMFAPDQLPPIQN